MNAYSFLFRDYTILFVDKEHFFTRGLDIWISLSPTGFVIADSFDILLIDNTESLIFLKLKDKAKMRLDIPLDMEDNGEYTMVVFSVLSETKHTDYDRLEMNITEANEYFTKAIMTPTVGMNYYGINPWPV